MKLDCAVQRCLVVFTSKPASVSHALSRSTKNLRQGSMRAAQMGTMYSSITLIHSSPLIFRAGSKRCNVGAMSRAPTMPDTITANEQAPKTVQNTEKLRLKCVKLYDKERREYRVQSGLKQCGECLRNFENACLAREVPACRLFAPTNHCNQGPILHLWEDHKVALFSPDTNARSILIRAHTHLNYPSQKQWLPGIREKQEPPRRARSGAPTCSHESLVVMFSHEHQPTGRETASLDPTRVLTEG